MTDAAPLVLVVEDDPGIAQLLLDYLHHNGYRSHWITHGDQVVEWVAEQAPAMILLDLMLPGKNGITLCSEIRRFSMIPIIMITARVEEIDRILGLEIGANDYICKPFSPREVMARVKALFRTIAVTTTSPPTTSPFAVAEEKMEITVHGTPLDLTPVEFRLLLTLLQEPGRIFSRNQLMERLYLDHRVVTDRTIDSHVKNLRKKIAPVGDPEWIHSVYGVGYKLDPAAFSSTTNSRSKVVA